MKFLCAVALVGLLSACTVTVQQVEPGTRPAIDTALHGLVLSSSSFSGKYPEDARRPWMATEQHRCESYQMVYRYLEESSERTAGQLSAIPDGKNDWTLDDPHDNEVDNGLGFVAATLLPAGRYEVYFFTNICRGTAYYAAEEFSIPLEIKPGVATYIGEIVYKHRFYENFAGVTAPNAPDIEFRMDPNRDLPLLRSKYSFIDELDLEIVNLPWERRF